MDDRPVRVADYYGLTFHIEFGQVIEHRGWKSEERPATDEEREMWVILDRLAPKDLSKDE